MAALARNVPTTMGITNFMFICLSSGGNTDADIDVGEIVGWVTRNIGTDVLITAMAVCIDAGEEEDMSSFSFDILSSLGQCMTFLASVRWNKVRNTRK